MLSTLDCPPESDLEQAVEAFERAFAQGSAQLEDFLPAVDHPDYRDILGELIRVEIELLWGQRTPQPLERYLARFPRLQHDPALLGVVAFEEYRQRLQSGETITPDEYRRHFGIDLSMWPTLNPEAPAHDEDELRTNALASLDLQNAVEQVPPRESALPRTGDLILRRFRLKERLGKGAFGSVFLAERLDLFHRPVALKFLPGPSVEPEMLAQLIHENIVPIESVERYGEMLVICMPYRGRATLQHIVESLPRESIGVASTGRLFLSTLRERSGPRSSLSSASASSDASTIRKSGDSDVLPPPQTLATLQKLAGMPHVEAALRIALGIAAGLSHAHERGIVHRDLKPANVLLADDGTPMLLDFNLATQIRRDRPFDSTRMGGTFPYMAPEQIRAARDRTDCHDARSDLYSLGVVLFELLTGRLPFPKVKRAGEDFLGRLLESRRGAVADPRRLNPAVPQSVADIVQKLLAFDAAERYATAAAVREDIERHLIHLPLRHARETSLLARLGKFRRRHPRLTTALALSVMLLLPAAVAATAQGYRAYRIRETQRAEARLLRDDSLRLAFDVQTLAHARARDSRLFQLSRDRAEALVQRYGVEGDADWTVRPEVTHLNDAERVELIGGLGEAFRVVAGAVEEHARDTNDTALMGQAERWRKLADECFGKSGRPLLPPMNQPAPRPAKAPESAELAKLDDADLYRHACDLVSEAQFRQAVLAWNELLQRQPQHVMAWYYKATSLDGLGNHREAMAAWETCVALQPGFAACHQSLGLSAYRARHFARAERAFSEAFRLEPKLVNALVNRALCRSALGRLEQAERDLSEALDREASATVVYFLRSEVRRKLGHKHAADADFAEGMKQEPRDEWSYSTRGYYRALQGKEIAADALDDLDRALTINPRNAVALHNRMCVLEKLKGPRSAIRAADLYLTYYPDHAAMHANRGLLLARVGDVDAAEKEAHYCLRASPGSPSLHYQVGALYAALSKHESKYREKALHWLSASLANGFDRPELFQTDADLDAIRGDEQFTHLADLAKSQAELKAKRAAAKP